MAGKKEGAQQALDSDDSNLKMLWQLTVILLMIGFNGLERDTDFHACLSTESIKKKGADKMRQKESITR